MESRRSKAALFLAAFAARIAANASRGLSVSHFGDSAAYIGAATRLLREGVYPFRTDGFFFRAPGYPVFLAASTLGHPGWVALDKVWNAVLGAAAVVLLAAIARRVFDSSRIAIAVGAMAAVHPQFLYFGSDVESEPLYLLLALVSGFCLLVCVDRPSSGMGLLAGGSLALASLVRPSALALAPILAAPLFDRRFPTRVRRSLAGSAFLGFGLILSPWLLRNAVTFRALLPVNDEAGFTFYQGNSEWTSRYYRLRTREEYAGWMAAMNAEMRTRWASEIPGASDPNPARRSSAFFRASLRWIRSHPAEESRVLRDKAAQWLRPGVSPLVRSRSIVLATEVYGGALLLFAAAGLVSASRRGIVLACLSVAAVTMAVHVAFLVLLRYRAASWDPILILYAPSGILRLIGGLRR